MFDTAGLFCWQRLFSRERFLPFAVVKCLFCRTDTRDPSSPLYNHIAQCTSFGLKVHPYSFASPLFFICMSELGSHTMVVWGRRLGSLNRIQRSKFLFHGVQTTQDTRCQFLFVLCLLHNISNQSCCLPNPKEKTSYNSPLPLHVPSLLSLKSAGCF